MRMVSEMGLSALSVKSPHLEVRIVGRLLSDAGSTPPEPTAPTGLQPAPRAIAVPARAEEEGVHLIKSPMVGTFYRAPRPEAPPFTEVGRDVSAGDVLCIIEAMKLMNEVEADQSGVIEGILAENAQPVEFGQPLFKLRVT